MQRRIFLSALASLALARAATAADDVLAAAYAALTAEQRVAVKQEMQTGGLFEGPLDTSYDDTVKLALELAAEQVFSNGYDGPVIDITTAQGAAAYLKALAAGDLSKWLYGEGEEMDG